MSKIPKLTPQLSSASLKQIPLRTRDDNVLPAPRRKILGRRSKSVTDLRPQCLANKELRSKTTTKPLWRPPTTSKINKTAPKRPAPESSSEAVKPKISKPTKPAPYDYKARFNILQEKYINLQQTFKEKTGNYDGMLKENNELKNTVTSLTEQRDSLKILSDNLTVSNEILEQTNNSLKMELQTLKSDHGRLKNNYEVLKNNFSVMKDKDEVLEAENNNITKKYAESVNNCKLLHETLVLYKNYLSESEDKRKSLHNSLQELKGNVRVFCRIRPAKMKEAEKLLCHVNYLDENTLEIKKSKESISAINGKITNSKIEFCFDKIFPPYSSQEEVFEELAHLIQSAIDGYHVCVFAYGQTGSGKTFTMQGEESQLGMIPRAIDLIFHHIKRLEQCGWKYEVSANFLEIYNENIKDLLNPQSKLSYQIQHNAGKGITVTNVTNIKLSSGNELKQYMFKALRNRVVAATNFNEHSSRSHAVTKILLSGRHEENHLIYLGSISLVDLAGSECIKTSTQERAIETKNINKSLSTLGSVMLALHNKDDHIPYRNSKLTYLLQDCLGGNSKTLMFVNIAPFEECYNESINSLRFASKVKEIKISFKKNKTYTV